MTAPPPQPAPDTVAALVRLARALVSELRGRLVLVVAASATLAFVEGAGLVLLVPLLASIGLTVNDGATGRLAATIHGIFTAAGIRPSLPSILLVFVAISIAHASLYRVHLLLGPRLQEQFVKSLRRRAYEAIMRADWAYLVRQKTSDLVHAVTLDTDRVSTSVYQALTLSTGAIVAAVYFLVAARLSLGMTSIVAAAGLALLWTMRGRTRRATDRAEAFARASRMLFGMTSESLGGLKIARIVGAQGRSVEAFSTLAERLSAVYLEMLGAFAHTKVWLDVAAAVLVAALLLVAVEVFHLRGAGLLLLVFIFARIVPRLMALQESAQLVAAGLPSFTAVTRVIDECERHAERLDAGLVEARSLVLNGALRLETVSFRYDEHAPPVLDQVTLTIPAGRTTAIVGRSGAGKSTVADLMMGLVRPTTGSVRIDESILDDAVIGSWRRSVGYVPQDSFLLHDTIRANLRWACPDAGEDAMWRALELASARDFVAAHPDRLDAMVGDRGIRLSGGERQRLALARALLARPGVLILDEATSALDSINEHEILSAIARLHGRLTIVLITHRLSSIRGADLVYVLENGRVAQCGPWSELAARRDGAFRRLLDAQEDKTARHVLSGS